MLILVIKSLLSGWAGYQLSLLLIHSFGRTGWGKSLQDQMIGVYLGVTWMEDTLGGQVLMCKIILLHHQIIWSELFCFRCRLLILSSLRIEVGCVHALDRRLCILTHLLKQEAFLGGWNGGLLIEGHCIDVAVKHLVLRLALSIGRIELRAGWGAELMIARKYWWVVCSFHRIWRLILHRVGTHLSRIHCKVLVLAWELPLVLLLLDLVKLCLSYHLCVSNGVATLQLHFLMVLVLPELLLLLHLLHC